MSTKDQKIKEFLQTKRAPLDEWNTHEQLCLASAVACSGDQNWMSVSRALKGIVSSYSNRPNDWFISKSCATQYGKLLESVETPKRKKRTASDQNTSDLLPSTPVESLVKKLTTERIIELKKAIYEEQEEYAKLKEEILFLQGPSMDAYKIKEMRNQIEQEKIHKEHERILHVQWLKEREEKKLQHERQWRGPYKGGNAKAQQEKTQTTQDDVMEPDTTQQMQTSQAAPHVQSTSAATAPTLVTLLDNQQQKTSPVPTLNPEKFTAKKPTSSSNDEKDEDAELLAEFNELIDAEKFDIDEDLDDLNSIIMNPEILDENMKISDGELVKDSNDDSSQASLTDDYDKLKIKQIAEKIQDLAAEVAPVTTCKSFNDNQEQAAEIIRSIVQVEYKGNDEQYKEPPIGFNDENSSTNDNDLKKTTDDDHDDDEDGRKSSENDPKDQQPVKVTYNEDENSNSKDIVSTKEESRSRDLDDDDSDDGIFEDARLEVEDENAGTAAAATSDDESLEVTMRLSRAARKKASDSMTKHENKQSREQSDNDEMTVTPIRTRSRHSSTANNESLKNFTKEQDHCMWKARWDDCVKEMQKHRDYALVIDAKIIHDEMYKKVCLQPMNMKIIARNIETNVATLPGDIKRDFVVMCTNVVMLNSKGADFNQTVHQFTKDCIEIIDAHMSVEDAHYKNYRRQIKKKN